MKDGDIAKLYSKWNEINREKLSLYHEKKTPDIPLEDNKVAIKRFLNKYGYAFLKQFTAVRIGDAIAHAEPYGEVRVENANLVLSLAEEIVKSGECYTLKRLAINGDHLKALGYKGIEIKQKLDYVLDLVIKGKLNNEKQDILSVLKK